MDRVIIGTDPHKRSATIEVRDEREILLATGRFGMDKTGYRQLLGYVRQWPQRVWAVEGASGAGRPLAARLLAAGETVVDVPAKLAARVRVFDVGHGRKTDATDAHSIAIAALRTRGCGSWATMRTWRYCGCWPTAAMSCPAPEPRR